MKKLLAIIMAVAMLCTVVITANAGTPKSGTVTISGPDSIAIGSTADYTISVADCPDATSYAIEISLGDKFTIFKGQWTDTELSMKNFVKATGKGACTVGLTTNEETGDDELVAKDINGNVFKLTVKATAATTEPQDLTVTIIAKNGSSEVLNVTSTKALTAACAEHTFGDWSQKTPADCTTAEVLHRICTVCGTEETKAGEGALGHDLSDWTEKTPASCTTAQVLHRTCSRCDYEETKDGVAALGHAWGEWEVTTPASCDGDGEKTRTCTRACGATDTEVIPASHVFTDWTEKTPATCTKAQVLHRICTLCSKEETKAGVAALGHSFGDWQVTTPATCTTAGEETRICTKACGEEGATETRPIAATGHTFSDWIEKTPASCETAGLEYRYCTKICEEEGEYEERPIAALGHDWGDWEVVKPASDTEQGLERRVCKNNPEHVDERPIPITYKVEEGDNIDYKAADKGDLVVTSTADPSKLVAVKIDGVVVDPSNYTVTDGDYTKITIKAEYMATLAAGPHNVTVASTDGEANTTVAVEAAPATDNTSTETTNTSPKTGVDSMVEFWVAMMLLMLAAAFVARTLVKKNKAN